MKITASHLTPFIALLYAVFVDKLQGKGGKPDDETSLEISSLAKEVLPVWGADVPDLKALLVQILQGKNKEQAYQTLGQIIKVLVPQGKGDYKVPQVDLELLKALGAYFRTDSETAKARLIKYASLTKNAWITQQLTPKVGNQQDTKSELEALVRKLVGRKDTAMTVEEANKIKEMKPDSYKEYLRLRREFNQAWKDALVAFIRRSGKELVPYKDAVNYLRVNGIDHMMPSGFVGLIDDLGRFYTSKGKLIDGVPNAVNFPEVTMNPTYGKPEGGDWVFLAQRSDGSPGSYFYTAEFKKDQAKAKFKKVADLSGVMVNMRKKWFAKVKQFNITQPDHVAAVILEILFEFAARIGSVGNAAHGSSTYGVGTLLVKHAIIDPSGNITLRYKGKDGISTVHKLLKGDPFQKYVIEALDQLLANKGPKDRIFTYDKGQRKVPVTGTQVNQEFKSCGAPAGTTIHKIRTYTGTKIFTEAMNEALEKKMPRNDKEAMDLFNKLAETVGKKLNHVRTIAGGGTKVTGATALAAYVDVSIQLLYWSTVGYRVPKFLERYSDDINQD